jgi:hypothetical protein
MVASGRSRRTFQAIIARYIKAIGNYSLKRMAWFVGEDEQALIGYYCFPIRLSLIV